MPDMKSMKLPKKSKKDNDVCCSIDGDNEYPYGLRIDLNSDSLKALGVKADDFKPGSSGKLVAEIEIVDVRTPSRKDSNQDSVELQITKLSVATGAKSKSKEYMDGQNEGPSSGEAQ